MIAYTTWTSTGPRKTEATTTWGDSWDSWDEWNGDGTEIWYYSEIATESDPEETVLRNVISPKFPIVFVINPKKNIVLVLPRYRRRMMRCNRHGLGLRIRE